MHYTVHSDTDHSSLLETKMVNKTFSYSSKMWEVVLVPTCLQPLLHPQAHEHVLSCEVEKHQ